MKQYNEELVVQINKKQYHTMINNVDILVKPIPDLDIDGAMDPRVHKYSNDSKSLGMVIASWVMNLLPKTFFNNRKDDELIEKFRESFNTVKSQKCIENIKSIEILINSEETKLPIYLYKPTEKIIKAPVLYFIHGGGFLGGHHEVVEELVKIIVDKYKILAVMIDYRLAPENPYPKAHLDVYEGYKWISNNIHYFNGDNKNIYVAGDSAGGNLAQYVTNRAIKNYNFNIKGQILLYPTINIANVKDVYTKFSWHKFNIYKKEKKEIRAGIKMMQSVANILKEVLLVDNADNQDLTPYNNDLYGLPKTLISVGEHDYFMLDALAYARKLVLSNVETRVILYKGLGHGYADCVGVYPQSEDLAIEIGKFIKDDNKA